MKQVLETRSRPFGRINKTYAKKLHTPKQEKKGETLPPPVRRRHCATWQVTRHVNQGWSWLLPCWRYLCKRILVQTCTGRMILTVPHHIPSKKLMKLFKLSIKQNCACFCPYTSTTFYIHLFHSTVTHLRDILDTELFVSTIDLYNYCDRHGNKADVESFHRLQIHSYK